MLIRDMEISDIDEVLEIENSAFTSAWNRQDFMYELQVNPFSKIVVATMESEIVGYLGYWMLGDQSQITTLATKANYLRKGIAKKLMDFCIEESVQANYQVMTLEVRISNDNAIKLYENCGFTKETIRKNYYADTGEDAYLMIRKLKEG